MLSRKIMAIYPAITLEDFGQFGTIKLRNDGEGDYIAEWNHPTLAQPAQEQLDAASGEPRHVVSESITRRQCSLQLLAMGMITFADALEMARSGVPPARVQAAFDQMPEPNRTMAMIDFAAANYYRNNPLIPDLMQSNGMTPEQVDQFFVAAAAL